MSKTEFFNDGSVFLLEDKDVDVNGHLVIDDKPVFVMIFGSFCGYCTKAEPEFQKLATAMKARGILLAAVQSDGSPSERALAQRLVPNMEGVPTFALFKNGNFMEIYSGERNAGAMARYLVNRLGSG